MSAYLLVYIGIGFLAGVSITRFAATRKEDDPWVLGLLFLAAQLLWPCLVLLSLVYAIGLACGGNSKPAS